MAILVEIIALYDEDPDIVFASALQFNEMRAAMSGLAAYSGLPDDAVVQEGMKYIVDVTMFGWMKTKGHVMYAEKVDVEARILQSREHNPNIKRWDHNLSVVEDGGKARWRDRVVIDAGLTTWPTALFGTYVYQRRHRFRNALEITSQRSPFKDPA